MPLTHEESEKLQRKILPEKYTGKFSSRVGTVQNTLWSCAFLYCSGSPSGHTKADADLFIREVIHEANRYHRGVMFSLIPQNGPIFDFVTTDPYPGILKVLDTVTSRMSGGYNVHLVKVSPCTQFEPAKL